jgi:probable phosphoglycerate mutase
MATTRLLLVRHGAADAADAGIIAGIKGCTGLSDLGRRQAEALRDRLAAHPIPVDVVQTSVLPRAIETAAIIAPALGGGPAVQDCDLCELHPGECDGMTWEEWRSTYGVDPSRNLDQEMSPGGESIISFARRVIAALERVLAGNEGRSIALVVHGGVIAASMLHLLGVDEEAVRRGRPFWFDPENTSLTQWTRDEGSGHWTLARYNDAAHLEGLAVTPA